MDIVQSKKNDSVETFVSSLPPSSSMKIPVAEKSDSEMKMSSSFQSNSGLKSKKVLSQNNELNSEKMKQMMKECQRLKHDNEVLKCAIHEVQIALKLIHSKVESEKNEHTQLLAQQKRQEVKYTKRLKVTRNVLSAICIVVTSAAVTIMANDIFRRDSSDDTDELEDSDNHSTSPSLNPLF
mmetsp:Transcript_9070/g.16336  ORF Transcript_9070/g.16336 Transcript_9070/m.16336 type:complete len:181 (-) Transcript_9070:186-728(-)